VAISTPIGYQEVPTYPKLTLISLILPDWKIRAGTNPLPTKDRFM